ncbi:bifunctional 3-phenylpropionate/cinnamic acid dioxygenase ferredoxin subunit [Photorhabdus temperata]|uniref:Phenylpropionate dioxygenase ferredoxin subunit n=2 Tax=Photorhabdus khanii TaxID=1004150 RepID=W3V4R4_9GAMM|nr:3-phenylpropionate/cinnamic acid dioxygenase ferredoxin subunit [Photorhabdus khanii]ETS30847.1 phenylpropionate dioxygenase ferredoxin subunit [Photorhabdus khanii NC19]MQL47327.1 bifunctional 3-phenylpropionate/cinnamic acid dioxygenase ferredoxin subunit [Photorhabdus khanii]OHV49159.1 bifunctional 3-phenylpropionate/cinnamic acid dioxygenase ferredoxin subunit [Photorhabdus temperata]
MSQLFACTVEELPDGEARKVEYTPDIALFHYNGEFFAVDDRCSHGNASISEGYLEDNATVECPLHTASFCLRTGRALCLPATDPLKTYPVVVEGGKIYITVSEEQ